VVVLLAGPLTFGTQVALQAVCCGQPAQTAFPQTMTRRIMHSFFLAAMQLAQLQVTVTAEIKGFYRAKWYRLKTGVTCSNVPLKKALFTVSGIWERAH
jgi:hypothetical protein